MAEPLDQLAGQAVAVVLDELQGRSLLPTVSGEVTGQLAQRVTAQLSRGVSAMVAEARRDVLRELEARPTLPVRERAVAIVSDLIKRLLKQEGCFFATGGGDWAETYDALCDHVATQLAAEPPLHPVQARLALEAQATAIVEDIWRVLRVEPVFADAVDGLRRGHPSQWAAIKRRLVDVVRPQLAPPSAGLTEAEARALPLGLYRVEWISGGSSLAAIGQDPAGARWLAPTNWLQPTVSGQAASAWWERVARMTPIEVAPK